MSGQPLHCCFTLGDRTQGTLWIWGWVIPRAGLDPSQKGNVSGPRREWNDDFCVAHYLACPLQQLSYPVNNKLNVSHTTLLAMLSYILFISESFDQNISQNSLRVLWKYVHPKIKTNFIPYWCSLHPPKFYPPGRKPTVSIEHDADWVSALVSRFWKKEILCSVSKIERPYLGRHRVSSTVTQPENSIYYTLNKSRISSLCSVPYCALLQSTLIRIFLFNTVF